MQPDTDIAAFGEVRFPNKVSPYEESRLRSNPAQICQTQRGASQVWASRSETP